MEDVAAANRRFYEAHENRDLHTMADVWEHGDEVVCVHPGWPILRGWDLVERSWRQIFEGPGRNQFVLTNDSIVVADTIAVVTLDENLIDSTSAGTVAATNIYRLGPTGWRLFSHHGSPVIGN